MAIMRGDGKFYFPDWMKKYARPLESDGLDIKAPDTGYIDPLPDDVQPDMVNSPAHYQLAGVEVIDIISAAVSKLQGVKRIGHMGYIFGNAIKYLLRHNHKGNPIQDLEKTKKHIDWMIEEYKKESEQK